MLIHSKNKVKHMKNINNKIKAIINSIKPPQKSVVCNYDNNYYGDQYCQAQVINK